VPGRVDGRLLTARAFGNAPRVTALPPPGLPAPGSRFDAAFLDDLPYSPDVLFFDRILEIDPDRSMVRCSMPTDVPLPL